MARFEMHNAEMATMGGENNSADVFCEMGLMYATGRGCEIDLVSAHKWLNIAAIKFRSLHFGSLHGFGSRGESRARSVAGRVDAGQRDRCE